MNAGMRFSFHASYRAKPTLTQCSGLENPIRNGIARTSPKRARKATYGVRELVAGALLATESTSDGATVGLVASLGAWLVIDTAAESAREPRSEIAARIASDESVTTTERYVSPIASA